MSEEKIEVKRYADWKGSLSTFLKVGDRVDEEMVRYFMNVLPPAHFSSMLIQIGEPVDHVDDKATFSTIAVIDGHWTYMGYCHKGETVERVNVI